MPSAQKPAGAEDAERALSRDQPVAADAAAPTPANQGSASAAGAEFTDEDLQQDPLGNGDLLTGAAQVRHRHHGLLSCTLYLAALFIGLQVSGAMVYSSQLWNWQPLCS